MTDHALITQTLAKHPDVTAAALTRLTVAGRELTVAVAAVGDYVSGPALREHLWQELGGDAPDAVVVFDRLPGDADTPDRAAVARAAEELGDGLVFQPPAGPVEEGLARAWADALGLPRVGACDDFLDLGGDSVAAVRIMARLEDEYGLLIDTHELLDAGTVRGLAALVAARDAVPGD